MRRRHRSDISSRWAIQELSTRFRSMRSSIKIIFPYTQTIFPPSSLRADHNGASRLRFTGLRSVSSTCPRDLRLTPTPSCPRNSRLLPLADPPLVSPALQPSLLQRYAHDQISSLAFSLRLDTRNIVLHECEWNRRVLCLRKLDFCQRTRPRCGHVP